MNAFKHLTAGILLVVLWSVVPFRLLTLAGETFMVRPGAPHFTYADTGYWPAINLETRLVGMGWTVEYAPHPNVMGIDVYGFTDPDKHHIVVDSTLHWSARAAVLAHEAGHTVEPAWVTRTEGDCFAESVATLVAHDGFRDHARFMAGSRWTCLGVILAESPAIYHAAALLLE